MPNDFAPALLLIVVPLVYFASRRRWLGTRRGRTIVAAISLLAVAIGFPYVGLDLVQLKTLKLLLAAAVAGLLLLRQLRIGWGREPRAYLAALGVAAALSMTIYLNFFSFHGQRVFVQLHDVAHYYLGSKYFDELGYDSLYTAMLRAEAEVYENRFKVLEARDLENNEIVDIRVLLRRSHEVKDRFSPERWKDFQTDVRHLRESLGTSYAKVYVDQGFNATPFWALVGGALANRVPAGSERGIFLLTLLDPLLLALLFSAIGWAFGRQALLLSIAFFGICFGAGFAWTGGAFLRYLWLFGAVVGLCCLRRGRPAAAGALLALATIVRLFPVFLVLGLAVRAADGLLRRRRRVPAHRRFLASFVVTGLAFFALTGLLGRGYGSWEDFRENTELYVRRKASNMVGLTQILSAQPRSGDLTYEKYVASRERRTRIYLGQLATVFLASLVWMVWAGRRRNDVEASVMGLVPLYCGLNLAGYYWVLLLLPILAHRSRERLALLFAGEAFAYTLMLCEPSEGRLYLYRGWLILLALLGLWLPGRIAHRNPPRPRGGAPGGAPGGSPERSAPRTGRMSG